MVIERRKRRSDFRDEALKFWFSSVARTNKLTGFVLADPSGLLIASNMARQDSEEVAARAPFALEERQPSTTVSGLPVSVRPMAVDNMELCLCAVGQPSQSAMGLEVAAAGVQRILANN